MKPSDFHPDSWFQILLEIDSGRQPDLKDILAALRRGEPVPPRAQSYIARLLDGSARKRGRPPKWNDPFALISLRHTVDKYRIWFEEGFLDPENRTPSQAAFKRAARDHHIDVDTAEKYHAKAGRLLAKFNREGWPKVQIGADGLPILPGEK